MNRREKCWSKVYIIHPNFISKRLCDFAIKRVNLEFASALYRNAVQDEATTTFWVIRDSYIVLLNPEKKRITPAIINITIFDFRFNFLCMQLVLTMTENHIKQPQQACRAIDDK